MTNTATPASLHRALKANYRSQWDEGRDEVCQQMLAELVSTVGLERLTTAVYAMIAKETFFTEAVLRSYIPDAIVVKRFCDACRNNVGFILFPKWEVNEKWGIRAKPCAHNCECTKCGDEGWVRKFGLPGNRPEHFEACNCIAGDRFQPRGAVETNPPDQKLRAAGE